MLGKGIRLLVFQAQQAMFAGLLGPGVIWWGYIVVLIHAVYSSYSLFVMIVNELVDLGWWRNVILLRLRHGKI